MKRHLMFVLLLVGGPGSWASAQAPAGAEFVVNAYTTAAQLLPGIASDAAGNFVVVWASYAQDGSAYGVFGRRYSASGAPRGTEFQVNTHTADRQMRASVVAHSSGSFVVAWESWGSQDGQSRAVFAQRYDAAGARLGSEFLVNTWTTSEQYRPRLAMNAAGDFVVVWQSLGQDGSNYGVFGQRYDASGARRGSEFRANSFTTGAQWAQSVAMDTAGNFVVVWSSVGQDGSGEGIFAQRYDAAGSPRGSEFRVNSFTTSDQYRPRVASDPAGNFVVAWASQGQDGSGWGIFARRYDASGSPQGAEWRVNAYTTSDQIQPWPACDESGAFVVAWTSYGQDGSSHGLFARRYEASGAARGAEFRINTFTTDSQYGPAVASDPAGNFVVAWRSSGTDGSGMGISGQRFGGLVPTALAVDASASTDSDGNRVFEPGETVAVAPSWRNVNGAAQTVGGIGLSFSGPAASGVSYDLTDPAASYGTVANGATALCTDCYQAGILFAGTRPATHWDATFTERLTPDALGETKLWTLHVGDSFSDVPRPSSYYRFVETLLHKNVTGGCSASTYCPTSAR